MSNALPGSAPQAESAVAPVGEPAPEDSEAVVAPESASGEAVVPAARFNGLMGRFHQEQARAAQAEARLAELESRLTQPEEMPVTADTSALEQQVAALTEMLVSERMENAKRQVLEDFPDVKPLADLLVADSPEGLRSVAQMISERLQASAPTPPAPTEETGEEATPPPAGGTTTTEPPAPPAPVVAGGTAVESGGQVNVADQIREAIEKQDFKGFLRAKAAEAAAARGGGELVLG